MRRLYRYIVKETQDRMILRDILRRELHISASLLKRMKLREGAILLNGMSSFVNVSVHAGDIIEVQLEDENRLSENVVPTKGALDIRFENEDVLVVSKPGNMPVHPSQGNYENSLGNIVVWHYGEQGERIVYRPVNRLDRGTSGLMVIAKNAYAHAFLGEQLHSECFLREYLAVVHGEMRLGCGMVDAPITRKEGSTIERMVDVNGKRAVTHFNVLENVNGFSLVRLRLETGRTHQIRVHMAYIGHPLVGDFLYGDEKGELLGRTALHSAYIRFVLPFDGKTVELKDPLPQELGELIL